MATEYLDSKDKVLLVTETSADRHSRFCIVAKRCRQTYIIRWSALIINEQISGAVAHVYASQRASTGGNLVLLQPAIVVNAMT